MAWFKVGDIAKLLPLNIVEEKINKHNLEVRCNLLDGMKIAFTFDRVAKITVVDLLTMNEDKLHCYKIELVDEIINRRFWGYKEYWFQEDWFEIPPEVYKAKLEEFIK